MAGLRVATVSTVALRPSARSWRTAAWATCCSGVGNQFKAQIFAASVLCVVLAVVLDLILVRRAVAADAVDPRGTSGVTCFADASAYLTDGATGAATDGHRRRCSSQQLLLTVTASLVAVVVGLPLALWLGHRGRGGFLAINMSNVGRAVPMFAVLAGPRRSARSAPTIRAVRSRRAGHADRPGAVRAAADHHQRLRRHARGRPRHRRGGARHGHDRACRCSARSSCRWPLPSSSRASGWRWSRCGRPPRSRPWSPAPGSAGSSPRVRQPPHVRGRRRRDPGRGRRARSSRGIAALAERSARPDAAAPRRTRHRDAFVRRGHVTVAISPALSVARC